MEKFRTLINEVREQSHSAKQFLVAHGISNKALMIPLYYPAERCNVVLQGPAKDSPWLKDGKISPKDKVLVRKVSEEYTEPGEEPGQGNFYKKVKDKEVIEITVNDFIEDIYNAPENRETEEDMGFEDLDDEEKRANAISNIKQNDDAKKDKAKKELEKFTTDLQHLGSAELLNGLDVPQDDEGNILFDKIPEPTKVALDKLKTAFKLGIDMNDEYAHFLVWEAKNSTLIGIIKQKINEITDKEERKDLANTFKKQEKEWFKSNLSYKEIIKAANEWWKSISGVNINKIKEESILVEFGKIVNSKPISISYTDAKIDKYLYDLFGKDAVRFKTVPIINKPYNPDDPDADPTEELLIRGIVDINDLSDNGLIRVLDTVSGETRRINIGDLREIINRPENQETRLNTDEYRRTAGHQFDTLNPGYGGKFVTIPEPVIRQMLETMQNDDEGNYRYDYTMIDLIGKYEEELKDPSKHRDIVLLALQDYNGYDHRQHQIRYSPSEQCYKGLMEYEGHITAPVSHIWKGGH